MLQKVQNDTDPFLLQSFSNKIQEDYYKKFYLHDCVNELPTTK